MTEDLQKQLDTVNAQFKQAQGMLEALQTEKQVLNQTLGEVMTSNIQLRTGQILLEKQYRLIVDQLAAKEAELTETNNKLTVANAVIEKSTNLTPPEDDKKKK